MSGPVVLALRMLMATALYIFLGWGVWTLWKSIQTQGYGLAARRVPGISLKVQNRNVPPDLRHFSQAEILIGRDAHCDIHIEDETASTRHARLAYHHGQWWLEDLGSTNGTQLNDEALTIPTVVISGDRIRCGKTRLTINLGVDPNNPPTTQIPQSGEQHEN
jgi:pSer/pThr/pTyr-binding forkhead associated (FHA) protein